MKTVTVVYDEKQVADPGKQLSETKGYIPSPSARKPRELAEALLSQKDFPVNMVLPDCLTIDDFKLCHDRQYVDDVMSLKRNNGFGSKSQSVIDSLPYTNGAMYKAARIATADDFPCALVSGFHHAGYKGWEGLGWYCTFNGLAITAIKMIQEGRVGDVTIVDCDMHHGNGTDDILSHLAIGSRIHHYSFGAWFDDEDTSENKTAEYLGFLNPVGGWIQEELSIHSPDLIIYQAGADVHIDDPYGGLLTTEQMYERDKRMFTIAKDLKIPLCWCLAGGYQVESDGSIQKVLDLHLNTFKAYQEVMNDETISSGAKHNREGSSTPENDYWWL